MTAAERGDGLGLREPPGSLALVRLSALGDTVHVMPLVASIHRAWPACRISWVIQPGPYALMRGRPDVADYPLFRRELGWRAFPDFRRRVRDRRFDLVLDVHRALKAGLVTAILRAPVKVGFDRSRARDLNWLFTTHRIPPRRPRHVQDQLFEFLDYLGVPVVREWDFFFSEEEEEARDAFFERYDRPVLATVLRSSTPDKDWTLKGYARVLEIAQFELGLQPLLVGGASAAEAEAARGLRALTRATPHDARADDIRRLAWLLQGSAVLLSPDTGPLHMGVALGTPTVGLYGFTDPKRSGPYRRFADLTVDRYDGSARREPSRRTRPGRMERITAEEVAEKLERAVERYVDKTEDRAVDDG